MALTPGYAASIQITSTPSVSMTNEAMTDSGDHKTFNVTNAAHQCWDKTQAFTVQTAPDGVTWTTVTTGFTINYPIGQVVFAVAVSGATPSCRISAGFYFPFAFLGFSKNFEIVVNNTNLDVTAFTSPATQWKTYIPGVNDTTVKLNNWWIDNTFLSHLNNADLLVLQLKPGQNANQRLQGFAKTKTSALKAAVAAAVTEDLDFVIDGQLFYVPS